MDRNLNNLIRKYISDSSNYAAHKIAQYVARVKGVNEEAYQESREKRIRQASHEHKQSLDFIEPEWMAAVIEAGLDETSEISPYDLPEVGIWVVRNETAIRGIRRLIEAYHPEDDMPIMDDYEDEDEYDEAIAEWEENRNYGWYPVGDTGIMAADYWNYLLLGHKAGGGEDRWLKLYLALGLKWHGDD